MKVWSSCGVMSFGPPAADNSNDLLMVILARDESGVLTEKGFAAVADNLDRLERYVNNDLGRILLKRVRLNMDAIKSGLLVKKAMEDAIEQHSSDLDRLVEITKLENGVC